MTISFDIPADIESHLRSQGTDASAAAREAFLVDLFRRGRISHVQLAAAMSLDRYETDALLKRHQVFDGSLTVEDIEADRRTLERVLGPVRKSSPE